MRQETPGVFAELVEHGVRAYQHAQQINLVTITVACIAEAAAVGASTLDSWRSRTLRRIPRSFHVLQRFAEVCVKGAPELGPEWVRALFLEAGMAGYCDEAIAAIFPEEEEHPPEAIQSTGSAAQVGVVPGLPSSYVARRMYLDTLKAKVWIARATGGCIPLVGMAGTGKTTLMAALGHDREVRALFPYGVRWCALQDGDDPLSLLRRIAASLGYARPEALIAIPDARQAVRDRLTGRFLLLLLDNLPTATPVELLRELGPGLVVVATTRRLHVAAALTGMEQSAVTVTQMTEDEAWELVNHIAPIHLEQRGTARQVFRTVTYHPYALAAVAQATRTLGMTWAEIATLLHSPSARPKLLRLAAVGIHDVWATLEADWQELDAQCRETLVALARLGGSAPGERARALVGLGMSAIDVTIVLKQLAMMHLLPPDDQEDAGGLHWLVRDFVAEKMIG